MNSDQKHNIEKLLNQLADSLVRVWRYFTLISGLHYGSIEHKVGLERFPEVCDELWRALYDALFASVGTIIDRTKSVHSLKNLLDSAVRYAQGDQELAAQLRAIRRELESKQNEPVSKLEAWRHNVVAHRTQAGVDPNFYERNKITLTQVRDGIVYLEKIFNSLSLLLIGTVHEVRSQADPLNLECRTAMKHLGQGQ